VILVKELRWHKATHFTDHLFLVNQMELQKPRQFFFSLVLFSFRYWIELNCIRVFFKVMLLLLLV
jgi:hypothetical protein